METEANRPNTAKFSEVKIVFDLKYFKLLFLIDIFSFERFCKILLKQNAKCTKD